MSKKVYTTKTGSALILTILTITTIMIVILSVSKAANSYLSQAFRLNDAFIAQNAAETGMDMFNTFTNSGANLATGDITIDITHDSNTCAGPNAACIIYSTDVFSGLFTATGTYGNISHTFYRQLDGSWTLSP